MAINFQSKFHCFKLNLYFFLGLIFLFIFPLHSQNQSFELGLPYIRNFTQKEYGTNAHTQNWSIVQDQRGVIYVGNTTGILEYDGVFWRQIGHIGKAGVVFSLAIDANNRIYVGSFNELGYLAPDSIGQMQYVSLLDKLPKACRNCANVWYIHMLKQSVYFMTPKYILRFKNGKFNVWEATTRFGRSIVHNQRYYVKQQNLPLMVLSDDSLVTVSGLETFREDQIHSILSGGKGNMLIGTVEDGLYLFDGDKLSPFAVSSKELIVSSKCAGGMLLADSSIVLNSYNNGIIVLNRKGELIANVTKSSGLVNDRIHAMFADKENGLWLATNNGISRLELPSPFTCYNEQLGVEGKIEKICRHQGALYAATSRGIYRLTSKQVTNSEPSKEAPFTFFERIEGINDRCWDMLSFGPRLLVVTRLGFYDISENKTILLDYYKRAGFRLERSQQDSNRIFIGLDDGLASMYYNRKDPDNHWIDEGRLAQFNQRSRWIAEDEKGAIWICTSYNGVWQVAISKDAKAPGQIWKNAVVTQYDTSDGLPSMKTNRVFNIGDRVLLGTQNGAYKYSHNQRRLVPATFNGLPSYHNSWEVTRLADGGQSNLWMLLLEGSSHYELGKAVCQADNNYYWLAKPFYRYATTKINCIFQDTNEITWLGHDNGIIRYDAKIKKDNATEFSALVRRIIVNGDSIIYAGTSGISDSLSQYEKKSPVLPYNDNALRFEYAATSFDGNNTNRFQYFLEGFDKNWSAWTNETTKDYTNLPEGDFSFKVKARNIHKHISSEDVFRFKILPPWYRTVWAYLIYVFMFAAFFMMSVKWRSRHLEKEKMALEKLVSQRTEEVRVQAEKLKEMDRMKSRFFANISHEFRTPLTLIIDPLNEMSAGTFKGDAKACFKVMKRNANRLLRLINQLLDLSKLESGGMALQARHGNVIPLLKGIVNSFASLAESKKIDLQFIGKQDKIDLWFDEDKLEKIMTNLLANAFKFTPEQGRISVAAELEVSENNLSNHIKITISDTGVGIPEERLPYIFARFYSEDDQNISEQEGSGIGLALTKELVELHYGKITVKSRFNEGTTFTFWLPLGKEHLQENEIVDDAFSDTIAPQDSAVTELAETVGDENEINLKSREFTSSKESDERYQILVIDDNRDVRDYIRQQLEFKYIVDEAPNGSVGIEIATRKIPDLIISDVMMPEMDGYELCHTLKSDIHTSHIPIILLTAKAEDQDKITGLETGADDYIVKPFNSRELLTRIENLITVRRTLQEKYQRDFLLKPDEIEYSGPDAEFLNRACEIVKENMSEPEFSVEEFAKQIGMSRVNLFRKLRAIAGESASDFIRTLRLKRAAQLMEQNTGNVTEIAFEVGFTSTAYFAKCFREQYGVTPSQFIKKGNR